MPLPLSPIDVPFSRASRQTSVPISLFGVVPGRRRRRLPRLPRPPMTRNSLPPPTKSLRKWEILQAGSSRPAQKSIRSREEIHAYVLETRWTTKKTPEERYASARSAEAFGLLPSFELDSFIVESSDRTNRRAI